MHQQVIIGLFQKRQYEKTKNMASHVSTNEKLLLSKKLRKGLLQQEKESRRIEDK